MMTVSMQKEVSHSTSLSAGKVVNHSFIIGGPIKPQVASFYQQGGGCQLGFVTDKTGPWQAGKTIVCHSG